MRTKILVVGIAIALLLSGSPHASADGSAGASPTTARTWGTNGRVSAILTTSSGVILGGDFTAVVDTNGRSYPANRLAKYLPSTGTFDTTWTPDVDGSVYALAVAGDQVFVAGAFANVRGTAHHSVAAVSLSSGLLDPSFTSTTDREVDALAVAGSTLFLAGNFTKVSDSSGTTARPNIAKVSIPSGVLDRTWAPVLAGRARAVLPTADSSKVYVGGDFASTDSLAYAGKLTLLSVADASIDPVFRGGPTNLSARVPTLGLALAGSALLVAAAGSGGACASLDATTGATRWSKHSNGDVQAVVSFGPLVYCGGHFSGSASFDGLNREKLAAVSMTGVTQSYAPGINSALGVWSMGTTPDALLVGGDFTKIDTLLQSGIAQFRDVTALTTASAPDGITTAAGDSTVTLTWGVPSTDGGYQPLSYRVSRSTDGGTTWVSIGTANQENFTDATAVNDTSYTYAVAAHNTAGDSPLTISMVVTPHSGTVTVPGVPSSFRATGAFQSSQLTWGVPATDGGSAITAYRVLRSTSSGQEVLLVDLPATARSYTDSAVNTQTRYFYTLQAVNAIGAGSPTTEAAASPSSGLPAAPVLTGSLSGGTVSLSWTISSEGGSPVTKYIVTRNGIRIGVVVAPTMSLVDPAPLSGTNNYQVRAVNSLGTSKLSNQVVITAP